MLGRQGARWIPVVVALVAQRPTVPVTEAPNLGRIGPQDPAVWGPRDAIGRESMPGHAM
jgi:hypothetical protein